MREAGAWRPGRPAATVGVDPENFLGHEKCFRMQTLFLVRLPWPVLPTDMTGPYTYYTRCVMWEIVCVVREIAAMCIKASCKKGATDERTKTNKNG